MNKLLFKNVRATLKDLPRYRPERLHWAVHYFVTILWNSVFFLIILHYKTSSIVCSMSIINIFTKQYAPCPSPSIMILQKGIAIRLEGRDLVVTLLASIYDDKKPWLKNDLFLITIQNTLIIFGFHQSKQIFTNKYRCCRPSIFKSQSCRVKFS